MKHYTQIEIVLQGKNESFEDYEKRLNKKMKIVSNCIMFVTPSAACDGRLCCLINIICQVPEK